MMKIKEDKAYHKFSAGRSSGVSGGVFFGGLGVSWGALEGFGAALGDCPGGAFSDLGALFGDLSIDFKAMATQ